MAVQEGISKSIDGFIGGGLIILRAGGETEGGSRDLGMILRSFAKKKLLRHSIVISS